jgi:hypothetical protein
MWKPSEEEIPRGRLRPCFLRPQPDDCGVFGRGLFPELR